MTNPRQPWEEGLALLTAPLSTDTRQRVRYVLTQGERADTVVVLPDPRDAAERWLTPALRDREGLRIVKGRGDDKASRYLLPLDGGHADARPLDVDVLTSAVLRLVAGLPEREGCDGVYTDLRRLCLDEPEKATAYLRRVVKAACRGTSLGIRPAPVLVADVAERGPAMTPAERLADHRARKARRAEETARAYLRDFDIDEEGGVITSADLWRYASNAIGEWLDMRAEDPDGWREDALADGLPVVPVMPGRTTLLRIAAEVLDRRRRRDGVVFVARAEDDLAALITDRTSTGTTAAVAV